MKYLIQIFSPWTQLTFLLLFLNFNRTCSFFLRLPKGSSSGQYLEGTISYAKDDLGKKVVSTILGIGTFNPYAAGG